jgi:MraZ protein
MLLGEYAHTLDNKNRVILPARFRAELSGGVVVTRGQDACLFVYPREHWETLAARLATLDPLSKDGRALQRLYFSGAVASDLDKQGRVTLPAALLQRAGVSKFVVVAGVFDHLEIWDDRIWRERLDEIRASGAAVADRLAELSREV